MAQCRAVAQFLSFDEISARTFEIVSQAKTFIGEFFHFSLFTRSLSLCFFFFILFFPIDLSARGCQRQPTETGGERPSRRAPLLGFSIEVAEGGPCGKG